MLNDMAIATKNMNALWIETQSDDIAESQFLILAILSQLDRMFVSICTMVAFPSLSTNSTLPVRLAPLLFGSISAYVRPHPELNSA